MTLESLIEHLRRNIEVAELTGRPVGSIHVDTAIDILAHLMSYERLLTGGNNG